MHELCSSWLCPYVCSCWQHENDVLVQVMAKHGKEIDSSAVASMPFAEATVKEALRLVPIVGVVARVALKTFEIGGYTIPKARLALSSLACEGAQASHQQFGGSSLQSIVNMFFSQL